MGLLFHGQAQNNALSFDGTNDFVSLPSVATNLNSFTIETWINPTAIPSSGYIAILNTNSWDATNGCSVHLQFENGNVVLSVYSLSTDYPCMKTKLTANSWQHIAVTYDKTNSLICFYLNGVLDNSISKTFPVAKIDAAELGAWNTSRYFNGQLDEVRIWNVARSASDIVNNMNTSISNPTATSGLIAYYPCNQGVAGGNNTSINTLTDFSALGKNGILTNFDLGTSNWGERTSGNNCLTFDGTDDYVDISTSELIDFRGGFSVTGLMKWDKFNSWSRMIDLGNGAGSDNILLANNGTSSAVSFSIRKGATETIITSSKVLNPNQWYYIAATVSATGTVSLYVDGVLDKSATGFNPPNSLVRSKQYLGKSNWATDSYFNGSMDNIGIWSRALSQSEITAGVAGFTGNESGLVHYYTFNQGDASGNNSAITTLNDVVGTNPKNGTLTNFRLQAMNTSNLVSGAKEWGIVYNLNGGTNDVANAATYSQGIELTLKNPVKTNYTFSGWFDNETFTGTALTSISATCAGNSVLFAKWTPNTYNITYKLNGGSNNPANPATYSYSVGLTLSTPTRTGYTFGGWFDNENFTGAEVTSISTTSTVNITLYAKWTVNTYTITYNLNGGTIDAPNSPNYTFGIGVNLNSPAKAGYTFSGWYNNEYFTGTALTSVGTGVSGNITLYAMFTIPFAGGTGTELDPWLISTPEQLSQLNLYLTAGHSDKYFKIINDIDLTTYISSGNPGYNGGYGWYCIGRFGIPFCGKVDGGGHLVKGLYIDATLGPNSSYQSNIGLFGETGNTFSLKDLTVQATWIMGQNQVGGMIGDNGGTVVNCHVVMVNDGKVGYPPYNLIVHVGGFVGFNEGYISQCSFSGGVIGSWYIGGFVGANNYKGVIDNCYAVGIVQGAENVGGFSGINANSISKCYASVNMEWDALTKYKGGFSSVSGNNSNCYWNKELSTLTTSPGMDAAYGKTTAELKLQSTFTGWDFVGETANGTADIWSFNSSYNNGYSCLKKQLLPFVTIQTVSATTSFTATATGGISYLGTTNPTQYGIVWSTEANPTVALLTKTDEGTASAVGAFTSNLTGLTANTIYHVRAYATNATGTVYGDEVDFTTLTPGTWTGVTNTDWNTATNWAGGSVPTSANDVIIPNVANDPIIGISTSADCNNLTVNSGANLTIASTALGTGSLIVHGSTSGNVTAQRYMTGGAWHMISSPVSESVSDFLPANSNIATKNITTRGMKDYIESTDAWSDLFTNSSSGSMGGGDGYAVWLASPGTVNFTGSLQTGSPSVPVSHGKYGWNLVGNPYSSAIAINTKAGTNNFIDYNSNSMVPSYVGIYYWNGSSYNAVNLSDDAFYAQVGQGFFVKAKTGGGSVSFTPAMQSHQTGAAFKSAVITWPEIKLKASLGTLSSATKIKFNEAMSSGLDLGYDAGMMKSGFDLYTKLVDDNGVDFTIQCLPLATNNETIIPVGLESSTKGVVTFSVEMSNLPAECKVIFEDRVTGTFTPLTQSSTICTVQVDANSTVAGRFFIHTSLETSTLAIHPTTDDWKIYTTQGQIRISGAIAGNATASIYDILGRKIGDYNLQKGSVNNISCSEFKNGVYLLNIKQDGKTFTRKIVVNN